MMQTSSRGNKAEKSERQGGYTMLFALYVLCASSLVALGAASFIHARYESVCKKSTAFYHELDVKNEAAQKAWAYASR
jgi:hypothetical protein